METILTFVGSLQWNVRCDACSAAVRGIRASCAEHHGGVNLILWFWPLTGPNGAESSF